MAASNAAFSALVRRSTTANGALAAEDHPTNPWTSPARARSANYFNIRESVRELPVAASRQAFLDLYHKNQVIILTGGTGCGKTTQVPQFILYDDLPMAMAHQKVVCTQPRRVAAMEVAARVASELDVNLGVEVGYRFRHENVSDIRTLLLYTTDGHFLQVLKADPVLKGYSCVVVDEAHERSTATDMILVMLKHACRRRPDLKLVVTSATMNVNKFRAYFNGAPLFTIPGQTYPVEVFYLANAQTAFGGAYQTTVPDYVVAAVRLAVQISEREATGDILIFMPGKEDIGRTVDGIMHEVKNGVLALALHADMPKSRQSEVLAPLSGDKRHFRKCIVATNIAETSLTIDGIVYVIDTGLEKTMTYNPRLRMDILLVAPTSQTAAEQRKGRAGRTRPGKCFRLYSKHAFDNAMIKERLPEIQRCNMAGPILDLLRLEGNQSGGIMTFPYIDPPAPEVDDLLFLGLLDGLGQVSSKGDLAARLPLEPRHAAAFIQSLRSTPAPIWEVSAIVSLLNEDTIYLHSGPSPKWPDLIHATFKHPDGDHMTLLNVWHGFYRQADQICARKSAADRAKHLYHWCQVHFLHYESMMSARKTFEVLLDVAHKELNMGQDEEVLSAAGSTWMSPKLSQVVRKTLLKGGFMQIAIREPKGDGYRTLGENMPGLISPDSSVVGREYEFVMYDTFLRTYKCHFVNVTGIDSQWLFEEPLSLAYVNSLLTGYIQNSEKWFSIKQLIAAKAKFEKNK